MKVRVLGAYGGELAGARSSAYLIEDGLLLDAGGASAALSLEEARALEACVLTHAHLDHIASVPFLLDARIGGGTLTVHALEETIAALKAHVFNDLIWPDFQRIPDEKTPLLRYRAVAPERRFEIGALALTPVAVDHTVPTVGYVVSDGRSSAIFSADTGPTTRIWKVAAEIEDLKAILLEVSFPARLRHIAAESKHISTTTLAAELRKIGPRIPIYLNHLKPAFLDELRRELAPILAAHPNVRILEQDRVYDF